jgi:hypothetical protein
MVKMMLKTITHFGLPNALVRFCWGLKTTGLRNSKRHFQIKEITAKRKKYKVCVGYTVSKENGMGKTPLDLAGSQNTEANFAGCGTADTGSCVTLRDGKIYICSTVAHIQFFNKFFGKELRVTEDDYIDIYKANSKDEILAFLHKPFPFCRYCKLSESSGGLDWRVSKREITEWV